MKILVIGAGGREHALVWKIRQSSRVEKIYCAPGNGGIAELAECVSIFSEDIPALVDFAEREAIDFTIVGPEVPLSQGIVDEFQKKSLKIFGPTREGAELEASKAFAKEIMQKYGVPTGKGKVFNALNLAKEYIRVEGAPLVVKADGLAAGKGVFVCPTVEEAEAALELMMTKKVFGLAGERVIVEECLIGEEASFIALTDGKTILPLVPSQDHKAVFDQDKGPNTGGMGAYAPAPIVTTEMAETVMEQVFIPTLEGMKQEGRAFRGVLYAGLMLTASGPKVLEFNVRFGDPETQVILPLLESDLLELLEACLEGNLDKINLRWKQGSALCVVLASGGYPGSYQKGEEIFGLEKLASEKDVVAFHAGTSRKDSKVVTSGGRVLGITAWGENIQAAKDKAYLALEKINFEKMHYRKDIGAKALSGKTRKD